MSTVAEYPMSKSDSTSVKMRRTLLDMLKVIHAATGEKMSDYLNRVAQPHIFRDYKKAMEILNKRKVDHDHTNAD